MEEIRMKMGDFSKKEMGIIIELYFEHKQEFYDMLCIEDFVEQFIRYNEFGDIICVLDIDEKQENTDYEFEIFDRDKEHYLYGI